jgi:hypothetical protein
LRLNQLGTRVKEVGRIVGRALSAAVAVCLLASPSDAAVEADFNGDGLVDRVVLPRPPDTNIVVRLSNGAPQVLKFHDRIISIVATDINHDGEVDLGALSERHGVFVWLNKGKTSHGRLKALKRKHHLPRGFSLNKRGPLASAPGSSPDGPAANASQDDRDADHDEHAADVDHQRPSMEVPSLVVPRLTDARGVASPSRAPPSAHD